jgi:TonB family protein
MYKTIYTTVFITLFCISHASAQKDTVLVYMKNGPNLRGPGDAVLANNKDSADFIRMVTSPDTNVSKDLFPVIDFYLNGKPKLKGLSSTGSAFIILQGGCLELYPNGNKKMYSNYDKGNLTGDVRVYFPNGKLYMEGEYINGQLNLSTCKDSAGKALAEKGNGKWIKYNGDFTHIYEEGPVEYGLESGDWKGYLGDSAHYVCHYEKGEITTGTTYDKKGNQYPFTKAEVLPEFKGGIEKFTQFLQKNIRYPYTDKQNGTQGSVILRFVIERDGSLTNLRVSRSLSEGTDREAMRVLAMSPKWVPGSQYGLPVRVQYSVPVSFNLDGY